MKRVVGDISDNTSSVTNKQYYKFFFVATETATRHQCKLCLEIAKNKKLDELVGIVVQDTKKGYSNIISHLNKHHPDYASQFPTTGANAASKRLTFSGKVSLLSNDFSYCQTSKIYGWLDLIMTEGLPFNTVQKDTYRRFTDLERMSVASLKKYANALTREVEDLLAAAIPDKISLIFDGWTMDGMLLLN